MSRWQLSELAEICGGRLRGRDAGFDRVSTDTRTLVAGELFIALRGPRFDGHTFVPQALANGAVAALVDSAGVFDAGVGPLVEVDDTLKALGRLATDWRARFQGPVIAVTGSNGKTTVRSMIQAILSEQWPGHALATRGNYNNEIGLPLTLLRLAPDDRAAVIEMGANHHGEIARLTRITQPDVGLITNAGPAHLEGFGDLDGVARAKGELIEGLPAHGIAVLNAGDPRVDVWRKMAGSRSRIEFGLECGDVRLAETPRYAADGTRALVDTPVGNVALRLALPGRHNLINALAATAAAIAVDISPATITRGLASVRPEPGRLEPVAGPGGATLINDCYNANPGSLAASLDWLGEQPQPRWLVLGDMGELGESAGEAHAEAGRLAREAGVERLYAIGEQAAAAAEAFGPGAIHCWRIERLIEVLRNELRPNVTVLIKGSRSMGLERVVDSLRDRPERMAGRGG
ncbi:UDP-N-acetylmuramoyl-tripeptide--D-alanyl-D-alanine ligase [Natronospira bacteriovora]|uniref:UDP-N-acetylmuramoyl-tripeptide--D-alanyl-D-alanine ligase n=1 Tax=Natronospira bacteriovora TaxID=3069753 RepID=A0ABU0W947_9GAMM|nr:UDP-N-acetylmuramoyl-tripeptide--D-alanyl-D-alanine ligase [Natronospira sp. AB-CW4]MDQ2069510.1 UDP-N-acetylmuramoyl-tripeptide--D-alanyl-D-alanine ligase [Natronospira sp. AB-CW4]